jgi:hypothetical protein
MVDAEPSVADGDFPGDEPEEAVVVEDKRDAWDSDVACGVMVCTEVIISVVTTTAPFGSVRVLVLDVKPV